MTSQHQVEGDVRPWSGVGGRGNWNRCHDEQSTCLVLEMCLRNVCEGGRGSYTSWHYIFMNIIFECTKLYLLSNSSANTTLGGTLYAYLASEGGAVQ